MESAGYILVILMAAAYWAGLLLALVVAISGIVVFIKRRRGWKPPSSIPSHLIQIWIGFSFLLLLGLAFQVIRSLLP
jgi:hypothetical protein